MTALCDSRSLRASFTSQEIKKKSDFFIFILYLFSARRRRSEIFLFNLVPMKEYCVIWVKWTRPGIKWRLLLEILLKCCKLLWWSLNLNVTRQIVIYLKRGDIRWKFEWILSFFISNLRQIYLKFRTDFLSQFLNLSGH